MSNRSPYFNRFVVLYTLLGVLTFLIVGRLFMLQIIEGEEYRTTAQNRLSKTMPQKAPRGEILDRYGRPLVSNRMGYSVQITKMTEDDSELNSIVLSLINICKEENISHYDTMPVSLSEPFEYTFYDESEEERQANIKKYLVSLKIKEDLSANDLIVNLCEKYNIDQSLSSQVKREIAGVRAEMELRLFSKRTAFTFANDVNMNAVTKIKESSVPLVGVNIMIEHIREYNEPMIASHILGRIGPIYKEEYDVLKDKGYSINDVLGKDGIEKVCENILKGKDGTYNIEQDENGKIISTVTSIPPIPGNDVILTLDLEMQKVVEKSLEETIKKISSSARGGEGYDADSGAAVVMNVHTGEILAMASYPTFDLSKFNETYNENYKNPAKPMWNRAIAGTYEPGSTYKMVTAVAGLEEGIINSRTTQTCKGIYNYYASSKYTPACWYRSGHGTVNVVSAIEKSCNIFFYETGRLLTIDKLNKYATKFGLAQYTGVELSGEAKGILAGPEYREKINSKWWPGDTIQAAIGQSDNLFTPLQLSNYIATLANGGTRYKTHLVKKVKEYSSSKVISEVTPEIMETVEMRAENHKLVMEGMRSVTEDGTASSLFKNFEISVGGKTGTSEVSKGSNNGVFTAFAPYDNPQIAIAVIVEHGAHGNTVAPVAKAAIEQYFVGSLTEYVENKEQMNISR